jgi:TonB family protein
MSNIELALESTRRNEATCLVVAAGIHILVLIWNPILLKSDFHAIHDFVTVDMVEQPGSSLLAEKPAKMSLMSTLKDMLMKPRAEEIAHYAPTPTMPRSNAPLQPLLKERPQPITAHFQPRSQTDEIAAMRAPQTIEAGAKTPVVPIGAPALQTKSFGGIRAKDLPFQISGQESISATPVSAIPIAVGNQSAKAGLGYSAPSLQESSRHHVGATPIGGAGSANEGMSLSARGPAPIATGGTGDVGGIPSGSANGNSLRDRAGSGGGGLVGRGLYGGGSGSGSGVGTGMGGMPGAAQELDSQISQGGGRSGVKSKGFEIAGPLTKRPIVRKVIPQYPAWAEEQGIIGSVRLYFTVTPEGAVRTYIRVTKTTGYPQLDQLGIDALKQWLFAPLNASEEGKGEWGIITFNFSLSSS